MDAVAKALNLCRFLSCIVFPGACAVWHPVIELIVICILAIVEAGVSALGGVVVVFLAQPVQVDVNALVFYILLTLLSPLLFKDLAKAVHCATY